MTESKMYCSRLILCQSKIEWITYLVFAISSSFSFPLPLFYEYTRKGSIILLNLRYDLLSHCIFKITHVHCVVILDSTFVFMNSREQSKQTHKACLKCQHVSYCRWCLGAALTYTRNFSSFLFPLPLPLLINRFSCSRAFSITLFA